jgi:hypothetical protein
LVVQLHPDSLAHPSGPQSLKARDSMLLYLLGWLGLALSLVAIVTVLRVRFTTSTSADPRYELSEDADLRPDVKQIISELSDLGFLFRGCWQAPRNSLATGQVMLMESPETTDLAKVAVAKAGTMRTVFLLFQTRFNDGTQVITANNQVTAGSPPLPESTTLWLPEVRDAKQLYHVHKQASEKIGLGKKRLCLGEDPAEFLIAERMRLFQHFVEAGYRYLEDASGVYRYTWKGAFHVTFRLVPPIRPLYRALKHRRTQRLLSEFGIHVEHQGRRAP